MKKKASGRRTRRTHNPAFKAQVALAAVREDRAVAELCEKSEVHPNPDHRVEAATARACCRGLDTGSRPESVNLASLRAKIGQLPLENDFLENALRAKLLEIGRGTVYYLPRPVSAAYEIVGRGNSVGHY